MPERSISMLRLVKFSLGRNATRLLLIAGDLGGAFLLGCLIKNFLPGLPSANYILQVWLLAMTGLWLFTYDIDKNFRLDLYLTYTRVLKIASFTAILYLLFFVVTRNFYSLTFLFWVTLAWTVWASALRFLLTKFAPPLRVLSFDQVPKLLQERQRVTWTTIIDPKKIQLTDYDFLLIDFTKQYPKESQELLTHAHVAGLPIFSVPQIIEHLTGKISIEHFSDYWVEATFYIDPIYLRFKRLLDIAVIVLFAPILLTVGALIALAILICMGRPILYWQERMGLDDKIFKMVKFRTMVVDAEKMGSGSTAKNDIRITKLGIFLRKLRLDEWPQFYNVLKGDMSLIGPRPEYAPLVEDFMKNIPLFQVRHWLRPGISGWAQVMHGYASSNDEMRDKIRYDMFYLKNLSLWLDLIIIFRTIATILTGFGSR